VVRPDVKEIHMPPVSLKGVAYGTAIEIIPALVEEPGIVINPVAGTGAAVFVIGLQPGARNQGGQQGFPQTGGIPSRPRVLRQPALPGVPGAPVSMLTGGGGMGLSTGSEKSVRVFSLKPLTSGQGSLKPETVLTAIDTALALSDPEAKEKATMKLHSESGLLIINGFPDQLEAVTQVLSAMQRDRDSQYGAEYEKLKEENGKLRDELVALQKRVKDLERPTSRERPEPKQEAR
jgi:hypothetical protein